MGPSRQTDGDPAPPSRPEPPRRSPAREAFALARELVGSSPARWTLAALLLLTAGVTEAFGLLMIVPLLQVAGLADAAGEPGPVVETATRIAAGLSVPLTLPGVLGVFLGLAAVRAAVAWRRNILVIRLRLEFVDRVRADLYAAIAGASWGHLLGQRRSDIQQVLIDEVARMETAAFLLVQLAVSGTLASVQLAVATAVSPVIVAGAILLGFPLLLAIRPMLRRAHGLGMQLIGSGRILRGSVTDFLDGLKLAKSHNAEEPHLRRIERAAKTARERQIAFAQLSAATRAGLQFLAAAALAGLVWYALADTGLSLPELTLLALVFVRATPTALNLVQTTQQIANALPAHASTTGLREALRAAAEPIAGTSSAETTAPAPSREIELRDLSFAYPGTSAPALEQIDCRIPANAIFAIAGPSGAGKTTLVDLLLGLLSPTRGEILVDGAPLREPYLRRLRDSTAYVAQDPFLLHDSVRANLSSARAGATDADLWRALRLAGAASFVATLPDGLDTVVSDRGSRLSGGERQRIALAGALLREPAVLVLDEPTNQLDSASESWVIQTLSRLRGRMTVIVVSHGRTLLREADRILVLRAGRVEAAGAWPDVAAVVLEGIDAPRPASPSHACPDW